MQANDMFEYRNAIIDPFKDGNFLSEQLKKLVDAAYDYVLKDLKKYIQTTDSMSKKH